MATIDRNERGERAPVRNGHSSHRAGAAHSAKAGTGRAHAAASRKPRGTVQTKLDRIIHLGRELPRRIEAQLARNPAGVIAAVGAGSFVLGALLGSKLGRLALAAAIPYAVERVFEGVLGEKLGEYARGLADTEGEGAA